MKLPHDCINFLREFTRRLINISSTWEAIELLAEKESPEEWLDELIVTLAALSLHEIGYSAKEIAELLQLDRTHVENILAGATPFARLAARQFPQDSAWGLPCLDALRAMHVKARELEAELQQLQERLEGRRPQKT